MATKRIQAGERTYGVSVAIEVKIGKDRLSEYQQTVKEEIERSGGVYIVARNWDQFFKEWEAIL